MICWLLIIIYVSSLCHATDLRFFIGDIVIDRMRLLSSDSSLSARPDLLILLEERNGLTLVRRHLCFGSSTPNTPKDKDFPCVEWISSEETPGNFRGDNFSAATELVERARNGDPRVRFTHTARLSRVRSLGFFHLSFRRLGDDVWSWRKAFWKRDFRCVRSAKAYRCYLARTEGQAKLITWPAV